MLDSTVLIRAYGLTGACHCQVLDWAIPGIVDLTMVKFDAQSEDDYRHNFDLLHAALEKFGVSRVGFFALFNFLLNPLLSLWKFWKITD